MPDELNAQREIIDWLADIAPRARHIVSVCTGAFLLGEAGLLRGLTATTHWAALAALADVGAEPVEARWVDQGRIITAAGVSAGIDLTLWLTARMRGETLARAIQLVVEYDPSPPFQSGSRKNAGADAIASLGQPGGPALAARSLRLPRDEGTAW